jgi:L-ribulose-5-phosphate 3-epimerase
MGKIGIMQGRLLPMVGDRIQAFPGELWCDEFQSGAAIGIATIEWILESPLTSNPLFRDDGHQDFRTIQKDTGVKVDFVCADYFMEVPFVRMSKPVRDSNREVLTRAIDCCSDLGIRGIEIPLVDASEIRNQGEEDELASALAPCLNHAESRGVEIGLETSLNPERFLALLKRIDHPVIKANYDSGNSASLGYDSTEEIDAYGSWINNVHIKDRLVNGGTVPLGEGDADLPKVLASLKKAGYEGDYVIQGARQMGPESRTIRGYLELVQSWLGAV